MRLLLLPLVFLGLALSGVSVTGKGSLDDGCCQGEESCCLTRIESCCEVDTPEVTVVPGCPCGQHGPEDALGCSFELVLLAPHGREGLFRPEEQSTGRSEPGTVLGRVPSPETPPPRDQAS